MSHETIEQPIPEVRKSRLVGTWRSLPELHNPREELTIPVNKEGLYKKLKSAGFSQSGEVDLSHMTRGRSLVWDIYEGNLIIPKFPQGDDSVSGMVAVSRQIDQEGPENSGNVLGRFAMDPIPQERFTQDLEEVYNNLVYNPQKTAKEKVVGALGGIGCGTAFVLGVIGIGLIVTDTSEGWYGIVVGSVAGLAGGWALDDKTKQLREERVERELAKLSSPEQYFVGKEVGEKLDSLKYTATHNMFMRAVYDAAQEALGPVSNKAFLEGYRNRNPYIPYDKQKEYIAEYGAFKHGEIAKLSDGFQGLCEINTDYLRRRLAQPSNNAKEVESKST